MSGPVLRIEHKVTGRARYVSLGANFEITRERCDMVLLKWCRKYHNDGAQADDYWWTVLVPMEVPDG